ncbi:phasin family protein [Marinivivus vitaminiproducens]|uniref:phasin family protein n=1 Tax=Marinivivus vitaminiproducens TaxID=3035935 RepID=UPI00279BBE5A|nr:phasin family protein [Geminicoccaceae bacterium SCSIO 64248]
MAKTASAPKLPTFDIDALFAQAKANLDAATEAQSVFIDAAKSIGQLRADYAAETLAYAKSLMATTEPKPADAVVAEVRAAAERLLAATRKEIEISTKAQGDVAALVQARLAANFENMKKLAA